MCSRLLSYSAVGSVIVVSSVLIVGDVVSFRNDKYKLWYIVV